MKPETPELNEWCSQFGKEYTDRNYRPSVEAVDRLYLDTYGSTRSEINTEFIGGINRAAKVLEVGCNVGGILLSLEKMGFTDLHGIEPQSYAIEKHLSAAKVVQATAFAIPHPADSFDLVYTSGVLMHIHPDHVGKALAEIYRCSRRWIWGFESYDSAPTEIQYRGRPGMYWRGDFCAEYQRRFADLEVVKEKRLNRRTDGNFESVFLLRKRG